MVATTINSGVTVVTTETPPRQPRMMVCVCLRVNEKQDVSNNLRLTSGTRHGNTNNDTLLHLCENLRQTLQKKTMLMSK